MRAKNAVAGLAVTWFCWILWSFVGMPTLGAIIVATVVWLPAIAYAAKLDYHDAQK
jgi:L-asparagine transporter-like permease